MSGKQNRRSRKQGQTTGSMKQEETVEQLIDEYKYATWRVFDAVMVLKDSYQSSLGEEVTTHDGQLYGNTGPYTSRGMYLGRTPEEAVDNIAWVAAYRTGAPPEVQIRIAKAIAWKAVDRAETRSKQLRTADPVAWQAVQDEQGFSDDNRQLVREALREFADVE